MSEQHIVRVHEIMNTRFIMVERLETVADAVRRLKQAKARCMIVNKRNEDDEYGIVLLSDVAKKVIAPDRSPNRINVYEIMSKPVVSVSANMNIRYTARMFDHFGLTLAPVTGDDGKIVGVVSFTDIALQGLLDD